MINGMPKLQQALKNFLLGLPLILLAACSSAPPRLPVAVEQAQQADQAAHRAMREGALMRAREMFTQSLWLQQSLDNLAGTAMAALNLATVSYRLGDDSAALQQLDRILVDDAPPYPPELRAAAAFRKAVILVNGGQADMAELALQRASNECLKQCAYTSGISNLRARLALQKGDYAAAMQLAKIAMDTSGAEQEELANARRISAAAETALGRHNAALAHYHAALELDKELGMSARIAVDLNGIAKALEQLGRRAEADAYARRAEAVIEAGRFIPGNTTKKPMP